MEDIKLWQLEGSRATPLASNNRMESEQLFEETLVENPNLLIDGLTLVGRQTPTEGGPLDLLGVDPDGKLAVFELKRGTLFRETVAQVIDYASNLDDMDLEELAAHIAEKSGAHGIDRIDDFEDWYGQQFGDLESLKPLRLFLVGLGVDRRTERMVRFLAVNSEMDISLLTFHGFDQGGRTLLAKQVEVSATEEGRPTRRRRRRRSRAELQEILDAKLRESEVADLFDEVLAMWEAGWSSPRKAPGVFGLGLRLRNPRTGRYVALARLDPWPREVVMVFYPGTIRLCREEFRRWVEGDDVIPHETWPKNREPMSDPQPEIKLKLTRDVWSVHKARLTGLVQSVYEAWQDPEGDDDLP